jgi:hypothetical protein
MYEAVLAQFAQLWEALAARLTRVTQPLIRWVHQGHVAPVGCLVEAFVASESRGEILSPPENSVPQTIVLRYQEIGGLLCSKQRSNGTIVSI